MIGNIVATYGILTLAGGLGLFFFADEDKWFVGVLVAIMGIACTGIGVHFL